MNRLFQYFTGKYLAAWVVLLSDAAFVFFSYVVASILRYNFELASIHFENLMVQGIATTVVYISIFSINKTSSAVLRHSELKDLIKVVRSGLFACIILLVIASVLYYILDYVGIWLLPKSIIIIQFLLVAFLLSMSRLVAKAAYGAFLRNNSDLKTNILIFGAGESGRITCQTILSGRSSVKELRSVIGFVDDNKMLQGKSLLGLPIYSSERALTEDFLKKNDISQVVLSIQKLDALRKSQIAEICLEYAIEVREIPPYDRWIHGELSMKQIRPVRIENLLGRSEIVLESENINRELKNKIILVTGGAGSIGFEIARQALHFEPKKVVILDQAESALYDVEIALLNEFENAGDYFQIVLGDINDNGKMRSVFEDFKPDIIFHAAAYKHVPMMELNPYEAVRTNIFGTKTLADLSVEFGVGTFVLVSTDKAINPTNVMGASKRIAEMYTQELNRSTSSTSFVITRFGNVLGSNGSVIPHFQRQIERGGPVTITHKDITRYFMTIAEACNLVLEAGSMGNDGEIFVFDMGKPIRIYELAKKMIQLSGLKEGVDIKIEVIGLRPGEKLYEEVLANEENTLPTHHHKILKASVKEIDFEKLRPQLAQMSIQLAQFDKIELVKTMKEMVPEFISNNSEFSRLDELTV